MGRFAESRGCRMVHMIRHFGDQEDGGAPCGLCDVCAPQSASPRSFVRPARMNRSTRRGFLAALAENNGQATGRLHLETFPNGDVDRKSFEHLLGGLVAAGLGNLEDTSFTKRGKVIPFQRASLTAAGEAHEMTAAGLQLPKTAATKAGRAKRATARRATAKRSTTKRSTTKRSTAKRTTAKRSTAKRSTTRATTTRTTTRSRRAPASDE